MRKLSILATSCVLMQAALCASAITQAAPLRTTSADASSADLVSATPNGTMSVAQINAGLQKLAGDALSTARQPLDLFKIRYRSRDEKGRWVVLSGLLVLPRGGAPKGLVLYAHGTLHDRRLSPSRFNGANALPETTEAALIFASGGYAVALPDYLGLGDDATGAHPYPLGAINARNSVDMLAPTRRFIRQKNIAVGEKLFVTGYSEGGAVAMATLRVLEKPNAPFKVFAAAPMSGPYDLSGATRQSLLASAPNATIFAARLYFLTYALHSFHKNNGVKLSDYLKPAMAFAVSRDFKANLSDENLIKRLVITAALMRAKSQVGNVVTPRFLRAMQTLDTRDPFVRALKNNDAFDWSPRTKTLLVALQSDEIVVAQNTRNALGAMRRRGVSANVVRSSIVQNSKLNHVTFVPQALLQARRFFDGGFAAVN